MWSRGAAGGLDESAGCGGDEKGGMIRYWLYFQKKAKIFADELNVRCGVKFSS